MRSVFERVPNPLGKIAVGCGILACLLAWVPFLCVLKSPVGFIGIAIALLGILSAIMSERTSFFSPAGGLTLCLVPILMFSSSTNTFKKENFDKLKEGMSVTEVKKIMGSSGTRLLLEFPSDALSKDSISEVTNEDATDIYFWRKGITNFTIVYDGNKKIERKVIVDTKKKPNSNPKLFTLKMVRQAMMDEKSKEPEINSNPFASLMIDGFIHQIDEEIKKIESP